MQLLLRCPPPIPTNQISTAPTPPRLISGDGDREMDVLTREGVCGGGDNIVYVAVGKSMAKGEAILRSVAGKFVGSEICIVHVHQPSRTIPTLLGKMPASQANEAVVAAHREEEREKLFNHYTSIRRKIGVVMKILVLESDSVHHGLMGLVNEKRINKLVMGAVPFNRLKVISTSISGYAAKHAPRWCEIWFVNKANYFWIRDAGQLMHSMLLIAQPMAPNLDSLKMETLLYNKTPTLKELHSESVSSSSNTKMEEKSLFDTLIKVGGEVDLLKGEAVDELLRCKRSEAEALEAITKIRAFESARMQEIDRKREAEDMLRCIKKEQFEVLQKKEDAQKELEKSKTSIFVLERDIQIANCKSQEASSELKDIQASITALRHTKQKLWRQKNDALCCLERWTNHRRAEFRNCPNYIGYDDLPELQVFSLADVETATCNFSESFKLGQGGYGSVFKGELMEKTVAIKKLHPQSMDGQSHFQQEVQVLGRLKHPHLVNLLGVCPEAWSLIYDYLPCGTLEDRLFRSNNVSSLTWKIRVRIIAEIASVLLFLHTSTPKLVIHGDLKPENILLDSEFSCKICDFGLSSLMSLESPRCPSFRRHTSSKGAFPYADPEYHRTGILTPQSDIYSFGVIILQLMTGKSATGLVGEVRRAISLGNLQSMLQPTGDEWPSYVARRLANLGSKFCELNSRDRPGLTLTLVKELERLHLIEEIPIPCFFQCPISKELMHDPQVTADGFSYDGDSLREWLRSGGNTSPMTNLPLTHLQLTPNHALRQAIQDWVCNS